jgi:hypothetical protein
LKVLDIDQEQEQARQFRNTFRPIKDKNRTKVGNKANEGTYLNSSTTTTRAGGGGGGGGDGTSSLETSIKKDKGSTITSPPSSHIGNHLYSATPLEQSTSTRSYASSPSYSSSPAERIKSEETIDADILELISLSVDTTTTTENAAKSEGYRTDTSLKRSPPNGYSYVDPKNVDALDVHITQTELMSLSQEEGNGTNSSSSFKVTQNEELNKAISSSSQSSSMTSPSPLGNAPGFSFFRRRK